MYRIITAYVLCIMCCAQTTAQNYAARYFSISKGLPAHALYGSVQDKRGFLWIATENGISRFDGFQFKHYGIEDGLPDLEVLSVFIDSVGTLWALPFQKPAVYYDQNTDKFVALKTLSDKHFRSYKGFVLSDKAIAISDIHGYTYVISSITKTIVDSVNEHALINRLIKINEHDYGILLTNNYLLIHNHSVLLNKQFPFTIRYSLYKNGTLYCGYEKYLYKIDVTTGNVLSKKIYPFHVRQINNSASGIYLVSLEGRVLEVDTNTLTVKRQIWQNASVNDTYDAGNGLIWLSTKEEGLIMLRKQYMHSILNYSGNEVFNLNCLHIDGDQITAGNNRGEMIVCKKNFTEKVALTKSINLDAWVRNIFYNQPNYLIVSQLGLYQYSKGKTPQRIHPNFDGFKVAAKLNDTTFWLGTHGYLLLCKYKNHFYDLKVAYKGQRVTSIAPVSDSFCYVGSNDGLYKYHNQQLTKINLSGKIGFQKINTMCLDRQGNLWVAYGGDSILVLKNEKLKMVMRANDYFPGDIVKCLYAYGNHIWIGTNKSLGRIEVTGNSKASIHSTFYSIYDGLSGDQVNDIKAFDNKIYVATSNGITYFNDTLAFPANDIPVYIMSMSSGMKHYANPSQQTPVLSYKEHHIRFDVSAVDYSGLPGIWYQYRLNQFKWVSTKDPVIHLYELPYGKYTFSVQAFRRDGLPSSQIAEASFEIKAPIYLKPNFWYTTISIVFIIIGLVLWQLSKKKHQQRLFYLEQQKKMTDLEMQMMRAQINPHFIFNILNAIKQMIYDNEFKQANKYLDKFSDLLRANLYSRQKDIISLQQELEYIREYLDLEKLRFGDQFAYEIKVDDNLQLNQIFIPAMMLQPVVENAVKHGIRQLKQKKGLLCIKIMENNSVYRIEVLDNGPGLGFKLNENKNQNNGRGLEITRKRAEWHGIRFYIKDCEHEDANFTTMAIFEIPIFKKQVTWQPSLAI